LDLETIEALAMALNNFQGGVVLVSHDERLISLVVDEIWQVKKGDMTKSPPEPGYVRVFNGSFEEYKDKLRKEFEGGSLLTNKKKQDKREKEEKERLARFSETEWKETKPKINGIVVPKKAVDRTITLEKRGGDQPAARVVVAPLPETTPKLETDNNSGAYNSAGGYVPPHLRNKAPVAEVKDAWDDDDE